MYVKVLALIGFVAAASAADLSVGAGGGKLIFDKNITASPTIWRQTLNLTVNATNPEEVIGGVIITDNRPDKDGEATVVEGGEGEKNVTIELKGPAVFRGFDFSIKVFSREENENARSPNNPSQTGLETQNPQGPNVNDNSNQEPKNGDDIILGAPTPTAASSTEANKDAQAKINNPALVGKEQVRQNRDTEDQMTKDQAVPTPDDVDVTKDIKVNENANKTEQPEVDENLKKALDSIFDNFSQKAEDSLKVVPVATQAESEEDDDKDVEENRQVRHAYQPVVPKEIKEEDVTTTPKSEPSTTEKKEEEKKVPSTTEVSSTKSDEPTTESEVKTTEKMEEAIKGHHYGHYGHHQGVPLPYVN